MVIEEIKVDQAFIESMEKYRVPNKDLGLFGACGENVVVFAEHMLGVRLYAWQVYFLTRVTKAMENRDGDNPEFVAITSRQIGKSTALAILYLWAAVFNKCPSKDLKQHTNGVVTSASNDQAKKLLNEVKGLIRQGDIFMKEKYSNEDGSPRFGHIDAKGNYVGLLQGLLSENDPNNTQQITFKAGDDSTGEFLKGSKQGSVIKSYPPTQVVLGETFTIVAIDEAGKTDKISDMFFDEFLYPTGNYNNAVRLYTSTPWVSSGFFYRAVDPDETYHHGDLYDIALFSIEAIQIENPSYYDTVKKTIDSMIRVGKNDEVQRAYYCRFVKGERSYFDPEKVMPVFQPQLEMVDEYLGECDMGVDFGGETVSKTVITITRLTEDGIIERLYHKTYQVGEDMSLVSDIEELLTRFNVQRIIPDDCPAGWYRIKEMQKKQWNIQPMNFKADKVKKYGAFRSMLNKGYVDSYEDEDLRVEMLGMEFSEGQRSTIIRHAPGYSDDLIDSFIMSCYFFLNEDNKITFGTFED